MGRFFVGQGRKAPAERFAGTEGRAREAADYGKGVDGRMVEKASKTPKSVKAQITRASLVVAAAAILRSQGPGAVTYRRVAEWAGASSSSVGYYFDSISELLYEAAQHNMTLWGQRAEKAAADAESMTREECRKRCVELFLKASLPEGLIVPAAHYAQLIAAAESDLVTNAYQEGRKRLDAALRRIIQHADLGIEPPLVTAVVDGAAVKAISEGYDVTDVAERLLRSLMKVIQEQAEDKEGAQQALRGERKAASEN